MKPRCPRCGAEIEVMSIASVGVAICASTSCSYRYDEIDGDVTESPTQQGETSDCTCIRSTSGHIFVRHRDCPEHGTPYQQGDP